MKKRPMAALLLAAAFATLPGCFPVVATGVGAGVMVAIDRRTLGTQTEDEAIEWKAGFRVGDKLRDQGHFNFTSFNRKVLITGEAASEEVKAEVETIIAQIPNVQRVYGHLIVGPSSSLADRSNDSFVTSKVKSRSVDNGQFNPLHTKVVTESGIVFLLGMVTPSEADLAIQVARTTSGVKKVVPLFELITPAQARALDNAPSNQKTAAPAESRAP
ncbi:MAG: BON domain-containing protein [Candidatus Accumulibacter sp.]|jgi:osmotically-inducible protein OsmY|nr:BON domain-containing protein [Accumulibacter sp.]